MMSFGELDFHLCSNQLPSIQQAKSLKESTNVIYGQLKTLESAGLYIIEESGLWYITANSICGVVP